MRHLAIGLLAAVLATSSSATALAELKVDGHADAVGIDAADASLQDALDALQARYNLRYRSKDGLDTRVTGSFHGPLRQVVSRLLKGYDFAMSITSDGIDLVVLRQNSASSPAIVRAEAARIPAPPPPVMSAHEANSYERSRSR